MTELSIVGRDSKISGNQRQRLKARVGVIIFIVSVRHPDHPWFRSSAGWNGTARLPAQQPAYNLGRNVVQNRRGRNKRGLLFDRPVIPVGILDNRPLFNIRLMYKNNMSLSTVGSPADRGIG